MNKILMLSVATLASINMTGCAPKIGGNDYSVAGSGEISDTQRGRIVGKRVVNINAKDPEHQNDPAAGALLGGVGGGVAGSNIGSGKGAVAATAVGAIAGAIGGHFLEQKLTEQQGFEYQVELDNGQLLTLAQGADPEMNVGQRVLVITPIKSGNSTTISVGGRTNTSRARIVPDTTRR